MDFRINIFVLLLFLHIGFSDRQDLYDDDHARKYCGSHLAQALSKICKGNYNTIHKHGQVFRKQAYWENQYSADMPSSDTLSYPFQKRSDANAVVGGRLRRKRSGVYNECCEKSCSLAELASYCAAAPFRRRR